MRHYKKQFGYKRKCNNLKRVNRQKQSQKPRPIVAKLLNYEDKENVMQHAKKTQRNRDLHKRRLFQGDSYQTKVMG